ncbi:MAG: DUF2971 domain-containing protein [Bradyrhizobium sp.]|uniref:DUF2971 domain-containing protein n=1 Tax=Bradyrhizobium sp. TaxID=376 RepID=UPI003D0BD732
MPSALLEAQREFGIWAQRQLLDEQHASAPTVPLYHYTREASFRGILTGEKFWCFSHQHQSDPNEFEYSLKVARDVIRQIGTSADFFTHHLCGCLDDLLEHNRLSGPFEFYLSSFSRHRDHGPQWKEYGDGGKGFAIGLAPSLFQPDIDTLLPEANKNLHIGRVVYGDADTSARHRDAVAMAAEITNRVGMANIELVRTTGPSHYLVTMARELLAQQLIWNCLTAKEQRYHDEREVRGIIMNVKANFDPYRKTFNKRDYVEHALQLKVPGAIAEILVGPLAPPDAENAVRDFLRNEGYPAGIPVVRSMSAPMR